MAIVQSSLTEEILSRQEKAVIRGIYRAQQLSEARTALQKTLYTAVQDNGNSAKALSHNAETTAKIAELYTFLNSAIVSALVNTKVPAKSLVVKETPSTTK